MDTFLGWRLSVEWALLNFDRGRFETTLVRVGDALIIESSRGGRRASEGSAYHLGQVWWDAHTFEILVCRYVGGSGHFDGFEQ